MRLRANCKKWQNDTELGLSVVRNTMGSYSTTGNAGKKGNVNVLSIRRVPPASGKMVIESIMGSGDVKWTSLK